MNFLSLFAGIGGIDKGLERAGMRCVAQVEIAPFCRRVLAKHWPNVPRFEDVRTVTAKDFAEKIDLIAGGFPCQDISMAGRRAGMGEGTRSGLWSEFVRLIRELRPRFVLVENVAALLVPSARFPAPIGRVLGDLASLGFDAEWSVLSACAMGAPHSRERVFLVAHSNEVGCWSWGNRMSDATGFGHWKASKGQRKWKDVECWLRATFQSSDGATTNTQASGVPDGLSRELDDARKRECSAFGNAVVPQIAEYVGRLILSAIAERKEVAA